MTLAEIKRHLRPGQVFIVTNHREPGLGTVTARVDRLTGNYGFYLKHPLGESKVTWPPARYTEREDDGTLHLRGTGERAGLPFLTLVPAAATAEED